MQPLKADRAVRGYASRALWTPASLPLTSAHWRGNKSYLHGSQEGRQAEHYVWGGMKNDGQQHTKVIPCKPTNTFTEWLEYRTEAAGLWAVVTKKHHI